MKADLFNSDPRSFALELVENQLSSADHLLLCCLKYMSTDDVRDMLDSNELSPRFDEDEDDEDDSETIATDSDAYNTGFEAAKQGEPRNANPYAVCTWDYDQWDFGWDEQREDK